MKWDMTGIFSWSNVRLPSLLTGIYSRIELIKENRSVVEADFSMRYKAMKSMNWLMEVR